MSRNTTTSIEKPLLKDTFTCEGKQIMVAIFRDRMILNDETSNTVINYSLDVEFEMVSNQKTQKGFKIYAPSTAYGGENPEQDYVEYLFQKENWSGFEQWEQVLISKITCKGFSHRFNVVKKIGEGNFSKVYLIEDKRINSKYAAKKVPKEKLHDPKNRASLENEVKLLRMLDHENISKIYGVYEEGEFLYVVLEHIDGITLEEYFNQKRQKSADKNEIARILRQILKAVRTMKKSDILHRDIKPENIMITSKRQVKIIDFNLATLIDEPKYLFVRCGTAGYVAPEILQIKDSQFDSCRLQTISDVFSVGAIFFKLIFGKDLFTGSTSEIVKKNYKCSYTITDQMRNMMTNNEHEILVRMLDANPNTRITPTEALNHQYFEKFHVLPSRDNRASNKENENMMNKTQKSSTRTASTEASGHSILENEAEKGNRKGSIIERISELGKSIFAN